jgi:peroxiredoxin|tara:strand:- start:5775 stop:6071 length:297 start_codon:yes stop_codon:yes gene_type:complete
MPQFNKFYMQNKNDVNVVAVQLIGLDSMEDGQKFVDDKSIDFAVGPDTTGKVSVDYQISVYPTTIFVDSEGNIAEYWQGEINAEELEQKLTNLQRSKD